TIKTPQPAAKQATPISSTRTKRNSAQTSIQNKKKTISNTQLTQQTIKNPNHPPPGNNPPPNLPPCTRSRPISNTHQKQKNNHNKFVLQQNLNILLGCFYLFEKIF
ncbi:MAG: hypothetical protein K6T59_10775, partial [Bryobacteraceae bacterium]|nr:hypothetical protein [Bryobacteraceae bacterium]